MPTSIPSETLRRRWTKRRDRSLLIQRESPVRVGDASVQGRRRFNGHKGLAGKGMLEEGLVQQPAFPFHNSCFDFDTIPEQKKCAPRLLRWGWGPPMTTTTLLIPASKTAKVQGGVLP